VPEDLSEISIRGILAKMGKKIAVLGTAVLMVVLGSIRCGGPAEPGGQGADCYRAEECAAGYVCLEKKCSNDLSSVSFVPEGGIVPTEAGTVAPD
jgi:hypothetical protein